MKNFEELENFISTHENWYDLLKQKPYSLKSIKQCEWMPDLWIFNYNLFESDLSLPIVKQCRGTVVEIKDGKAKVVCGPYLKFFNYGDPNCDEIDWDTAVIREKVDGQLIKAFNYKGFIFWVSNGDFRLEANLTKTSSNIQDYKDLLFEAAIQPYKEHIPSWVRPTLLKSPCFEICNLPWLKQIPEGWTLMFELCSPYNRIIVDYPDIKLWFHGARDNEGNEREPEDVATMFTIPYEIPKKFNFKNMSEALNEIVHWDGLAHEGLVVCDKNYHRIKVKSENYLEEKFKRDFVDSLDRDDTIFKLIIEESYDDFLPSHPEIKEPINYMVERIEKVKGKIIELSQDAIDTKNKIGNQKDFSLWVMKNKRRLSSIYFGATKVGDAELYYKSIFDKNIKNAQGNEYRHFKDLEDLLNEYKD